MTGVFVNLKPLQRSDDETGARKFSSFNHNACQKFQDLLEVIYLRLRKIAVGLQRITVVNAGCFVIKLGTDATDVRVAVI